MVEPVECKGKYLKRCLHELNSMDFAYINCPVFLSSKDVEIPDSALGKSCTGKIICIVLLVPQNYRWF